MKSPDVWFVAKGTKGCGIKGMYHGIVTANICITNNNEIYVAFALAIWEMLPVSLSI